jgi:hypothetical protein
MSKEDLDDLAWRIMIHNEEYADLDRVFAVNGILKEEFDELSAEEQDDVIKRLAIGIQSFNAQLKDEIDKVRNWRRLPKVEVSGHEES